MTKKTDLKIALYIRVSTEEQAENPEGSIKNQEQRLRDAVKYRNTYSNFGNIVAVYTDAGISAKDMKRPQLQEMLKSVKRGEVDLIMVTELSRLSRNIRDFLSMWDLMKEYDCRFMSLREDFDTTSAAGEMLIFLLMTFAQFERKQTSERVEANIAARANRGLYNGGAIPIGYKRIPDRPGFLAIDEDAAATVKEVFHAFLQEGCLSKAAKWMNDNGYSMAKHMEGGGRFKRKGSFTVDNIHKILKNKMYIGVKVYRHKDERREAKAVWSPIIDEATFARANERLTKNKSKHKPDSYYKLPYLLSGLCRCMNCGSHLPGKSATGKTKKVGYYEHSWIAKKNSTLSKPLYKCDPHRVPAKKLELVVWQEVVKFLTEPTFISTMLDEYKKAHKVNPEMQEKARLKSKLYGINTQLDAAAERLSQLPKAVSASPIFKQMEKLETTKKEVEEALFKIQQGSQNTTDVLVKLSTFEEFADRYRKFLKDNAEPEIKKKIVQKFVKRVEIGLNTIKIHFNLDQGHYERELALTGRSLSHLKFCPS